MLEKLDNFLLGIITGIVLPALIYLIFIHSKIDVYSFIKGFYTDILPVFLSRCIFPNALLFFFFAWKDKLKFAKGILISTAALTAILLFISFIL